MFQTKQKSVSSINSLLRKKSIHFALLQAFCLLLTKY